MTSAILHRAAALVSLLALSIAGVLAQAPQKPAQNLRLIVFAGGFNLPVWAAQRQGFFAQNGVAVTLTNTPGSAYQIAKLLEGEFDIGLTAIDNVIAYQEGQGEAKVMDNPDLFAFMGLDNGFLSLVAAPEIKSMADLRGKTLSVDAMTTGYAFVLREIVARGGLSESEVNYVRAGGVLNRFQELLAGKHSGTLLITPFEILAGNRGHPRLAGAQDVLGAYQGLVGAARRSWAGRNEAAVIGFLRAYRSAVEWLYDLKNHEIAEALLVANVPAMTPPLARQSLGVLLHGKSGFYKDVAIDLKGAQTVLALRSKFGVPQKTLTDPMKYIDLSYHEKAFGARR